MLDFVLDIAAATDWTSAAISTTFDLPLLCDQWYNVGILDVDRSGQQQQPTLTSVNIDKHIVSPMVKTS